MARLDTKELFYLLVGLAGLSAIIFPIISDIWEPFKKYPKFEVNLSPINNENLHPKIIVENIGDAQAKNAEIFIMSEERLDVYNFLCPEGNLTPSNSNTLTKILLPKMSTHIKCIVEFTNSTKGLIYNVAVTADDVNGINFQKSPPFDLQEMLIMNDTKYILDKLQEDYQRLTTFNKILTDVIIPMALVLLVASVFSLLSSSRYKKRQDKIEEDKFTQSLKQKETEIVTELNQTTNELKFIEDAISKQPEKDVPLYFLKRRDSLLSKIFELRNDRDQLRGTTVSNKDMHGLIGEFFDNWSTLEQRINELGFMMSEGKIRFPNISSIVHRLFLQDLISKTIEDEFHSLRRFRNDLAHGTLLVTDTELKSKIALLDQLLNQFNGITIPVYTNIIIPRGTSVPGCEENHECFIPEKLTIRVNERVTWTNDDTAAHTITSGTPDNGPDGIFDSSMIMAGTTFTFLFKEKGIYPYFCMVHPWQTGMIIVK